MTPAQSEKTNSMALKRKQIMNRRFSRPYNQQRERAGCWKAESATSSPVSLTFYILFYSGSFSPTRTIRRALFFSELFIFDFRPLYRWRRRCLTYFRVFAYQWIFFRWSKKMLLFGFIYLFSFRFCKLFLYYVREKLSTWDLRDLWNWNGDERERERAKGVRNEESLLQKREFAYEIRDLVITIF